MFHYKLKIRNFRTMADARQATSALTTASGHYMDTINCRGPVY